MTEFPNRHADLWRRVCAVVDKDTDIAHDREHVRRVYQWCVHLARQEELCPDLAGAAALVHDVVNVPKESEKRAQGSTLSAIAGADLLKASGYTMVEIAEVVEAVRTCSWSRGLAPSSRLGAVLQDADRLDAIGAIGVARNLMCAQSMASRGTNNRLYVPEDPLGTSGRPLDDRQNAVDHYAVKLLRLAEGMHTSTAREEAQRRHAFMLMFLESLGRDVCSPSPSSTP